MFCSERLIFYTSRAHQPVILLHKKKLSRDFSYYDKCYISNSLFLTKTILFIAFLLLFLLKNNRTLC